MIIQFARLNGYEPRYTKPLEDAFRRNPANQFVWGCIRFYYLHKFLSERQLVALENVRVTDEVVLDYDPNPEAGMAPVLGGVGAPRQISQQDSYDRLRKASVEKWEMGLSQREFYERLALEQEEEGMRALHEETDYVPYGGYGPEEFH
jgi:hypothetical protein